MVNKTVHAVYAETYDLNTAVGELSILGIHTPQSNNLKKIFHGFFEQYRKYRILGCNIKMVCASSQALDPSQMGLEAGQVDPRDVLNPILFKAVTGEGMNTILDLAYSNSTISGSSLNQIIADQQTSLDAYYGFLADDTFRKFHPQHGLEVNHLVPMVHKVATTQPFKYTGYSPLVDDIPNIDNGGQNSGHPSGFGSPGNGINAASPQKPILSVQNPSVFVSNGVAAMPWLDTAVPESVTAANGSHYQLITRVPRVFMGAIILPPAILQRLFFRMTIVWHLEFRDFRHATELGYPGEALSENVGGFGNTAYYNIYHSATPSKISNEASSFSTTDKVEVSEVMTKGL